MEQLKSPLRITSSEPKETKFAVTISEIIHVGIKNFSGGCASKSSFIIYLILK